jgi:hypothetical protein
VVVPLESAPLQNKTDANDSDTTQDAASLQEKGATAGHGHTTLTLEVLRAEILAETAASGHNTAYDRKFKMLSTSIRSMQQQFALLCNPGRACKLICGLSIGKAKVINRAIQDIGMGRYQWGLFVLCGFGWIADK